MFAARVLLESFGPTFAWIVYFVAAVIGVFVLYIGAAGFVAIFGNDKTSSRARAIFRDLLGLFGGRRR